MSETVKLTQECEQREGGYPCPEGSEEQEAISPGKHCSLRGRELTIVQLRATKEREPSSVHPEPLKITPCYRPKQRFRDIFFSFRSERDSAL